MPIQRAGGKRDMSSSAMIRPAIIASTSVIAEMIRVICSPDIRKSRLPQTTSQRNWYLNMCIPSIQTRHPSAATILGSGKIRSPCSEMTRSKLYGATIGSSLCFLAYFISRPSSLMVSTNRLM